MKTCLIVTSYNRPEYLKRCLDSLSRLETKPDVIIFIDDASDPANKIMDILADNKIKTNRYYYFKDQNLGIKDSLINGFSAAFGQFNCDLAINLDADAIVKPDFITKLKALYDGKHIVSGFNCDNPKNPLLAKGSGFVLRRHGNGINMLIDKKQYETIIKPALQSDGNWDFNSTNKLPFKICVPSVCQHIGLESSMGHIGADVACDFFQLSLPTVTLFGIDAHDPEGIKRAAEICTKDVEFGAVKIITERLFSGREAYSRFCIEKMNDYVQTGHVLIIHPDGYIQNPLAWDNDWLQYDYIGSSWWYKDGMNVGNGGFSLRSKKLLEILANLDLEVFHPEDAVICRDLRPWLEEKYGIKFAPEEVANRFAIEAYNVPHPDNRYSGQFGFHGYHVSGLPIPPKKAATVYKPNIQRATARKR